MPQRKPRRKRLSAVAPACMRHSYDHATISWTLQRNAAQHDLRRQMLHAGFGRSLQAWTSLAIKNGELAASGFEGEASDCPHQKMEMVLSRSVLKTAVCMFDASDPPVWAAKKK